MTNEILYVDNLKKEIENISGYEWKEILGRGHDQSKLRYLFTVFVQKYYPHYKDEYVATLIQRDRSLVVKARKVIKEELTNCNEEILRMYNSLQIWFDEYKRLHKPVLKLLT